MDKQIKQLKKIIKESEDQTGVEFKRKVIGINQLLVPVLLLNLAGLVVCINSDAISNAFNQLWLFLIGASSPPPPPL
jgi:hypothetical protein